MDFKDRIPKYFESRTYLDNLDRYIDILKNREEYLDLQLGSCVDNEKFSWLKAYFIDGDISSAKQHLYVQGMLIDKWRHRVDHHRRGAHWGTTSSMRVGPMAELLPFLLSDSHELLNRFIHWPYDEIDVSGAWKPVVGVAPVVQALLAGDVEKAKQNLNLYSLDLGTESNDEYYTNDVALLQSMIDGDDIAFQELIEPLCDASYLKKRKPFEHKMIEVIAVEATWLLKAMWILGHEIEIDHPLIPMDLMPIRPLERYTVPYFFLDGYDGDLPANYVNWLNRPSEELSAPAMPERQSTTIDIEYDPSTYANLREQILVQRLRSIGLTVTGNKEDGWQIIKDE